MTVGRKWKKLIARETPVQELKWEIYRAKQKAWHCRSRDCRVYAVLVQRIGNSLRMLKYGKLCVYQTSRMPLVW